MTADALSTLRRRNGVSGTVAASAASYAVGVPTVVARVALLAARALARALSTALVLAFLIGVVGTMVVWTGSLVGGLVGLILDLPLPSNWEFGDGWIALGAVLALLYVGGAAGYDLIQRRRAGALVAVRRRMDQAREMLHRALAQVSVDRSAASAINDRLAITRARDLTRIDVHRPVVTRPRGQPRPAYAWPAALLFGAPRRRTRLGEPQLTIEPFVGWRRWSVAPGTLVGLSPSDPVLTGVVIASVWEGPELLAFCSPHQRWPMWGPIPSVHPAPDVECRCGIYALKAPELADWTAVGVWAEGAVTLWGRVLEGTKGYRAEKARILSPLALRMGCRWPRTPETWLAHACPQPPEVVILDDEEYVPLCRQHADLMGDHEIRVDEFRGLMASGLGARYGVEILGKETLWT